MHDTFTVMTYNVHSCVGSDGTYSPERVADVIAGYAPDVVALQELDSGLIRSGLIDQAVQIAGLLNMEHHFHPSFGMEEGFYGNAVLSRLKMRLVKAEALPGYEKKPALEPRGAMWSLVDMEGAGVSLVNTHMGLNRHERLLQAERLSGDRWLKKALNGGPVVFCGDLNCTPLSGPYRRIARVLRDAQRILPGFRPRPTWPSLFPMARLDYIFISPGLDVVDIEVPKAERIRNASDHLPVIARLRLSGTD